MAIKVTAEKRVVAAITVAGIANNRMANMRQMTAQLMLTPSFRR